MIASRTVRCLMLAAATAGLAIAPAATSAAHASNPNTYYWVFNKGTDHTKGRLQLRVKHPDGSKKTMWSVRAGSGTGQNAEKSCKRNEGWLPNGTYKITHTFKNHHGAVAGPAVELSDHKCHNGTPRTELFIHSSYPWSSAHYSSEGCVKVSNTGGPSSASGHAKSVYSYTVKYRVKHLYVVS